MPLYDFQCECGLCVERIVPRTVRTIACPSCAEPLRQMKRLFPRRIHIGNSSQTYHRRAETIGQKFRNYPRELAILKARVEARGRAFSLEDAYHDCLAKRPLDPEGVVPHDDPLGHIKRLSEKRGDACEGMVTVKAAEKDPEADKGPALAEDIVQRLVAKKAKKDPGLASTKQKRKKLREDVFNRHSPPS